MFGEALKSASPWYPRRRSRLLLLLLVLVPALACSDSPTGPPGGDDPGDDPTGYDHRDPSGASARHFLSADDFDRLVVEVQYIEGFRPTDAGLQHLEEFLAARLNKPAGIDLRLASSPLEVDRQATYSAADARDIEEEHRTLYTEGSTLAAYLLFLDGQYAQSESVLGIAYNNTSMAIFAETIEAHTGGLGQPSRSTVEGTVANHEAGHLLGLVDNGTPMQTDHDHEGKHCDDENCLMYWAVRTTDFISNLLGGDIPDLDENCLEDLRANGGK